MKLNVKTHLRLWITFISIFLVTKSAHCASIGEHDTVTTEAPLRLQIPIEDNLETTTLENGVTSTTDPEDEESQVPSTTTATDIETTTANDIDTESPNIEKYENTTSTENEEPEAEQTTLEPTTTESNDVVYSDYADAAQIHLLHELINSTVQPCDNFYEYVCGDYDYLYSNQENEHEKSILSIHRHEEEQKLIGLLEGHWKHEKSTEEGSDETSTEGAWEKVKKIYATCMDTESLNRRGIQSILQSLRGVWPMITPDWDEETFSWEESIGQLRTKNLNVLIELDLGRDIQNAERFLLHLKPHPIDENFSLYDYRHKTVKFIKYRKYVELMLILFGVNPKVAAGLATDILELEKQLQDIRGNEEKNEVDTRLQATDLPNKLPKIDWNKYIAAAVDRDLQETDELLVQNFEYFEKLSTLMESTNASLVANFLYWKYIEANVEYLDDRFDDLHRLYLDKNAVDRQKKCLTHVQNLDPLRKKYIEQVYTAEIKKDLEKLTELLRSSFTDLIENSDLVGEITRRIALEKLNAIYFDVAFEELLTFDLDKEYEDLTVTEDDFFQNMINLNSHKAQKTLKTPYTLNTDWSTYPGMSVFYYILGNRITIPAAFLKTPFYNVKVRRTFNFGGIGSLIAKEMTNAFIGVGRSYGAYGTPKNWWDNDSLKKYDDRFQCFEKQINSTLSDNGVQIDKAMVEDNIAGFLGLEQSYKAYEKWLETHPEQIHSTISWENNIHKLFFIQFAYMHCNNHKNGADPQDSEEATTPNHSEYFVNSILSNSETFVDVYACRKLDDMNAIEKCRLF